MITDILESRKLTSSLIFFDTLGLHDTITRLVSLNPPLDGLPTPRANDFDLPSIVEHLGAAFHDLATRLRPRSLDPNSRGRVHSRCVQQVLQFAAIEHD